MIYFFLNFSFQDMGKCKSGKRKLRNKILGKFCSVTIRMNHNRARKKNVWSDKSQNFRFGTTEEIGLPPEAVCIWIWIGFIWEQSTGRKGWAQVQLTTSTSTICLPDQPILSSLAGRSWPSEVLAQKEGLTCLNPCPHFLSLQRGSQASTLVLISLRKHESPIPTSRGLCSLQEGQTLSPSIAQAFTDMGWTLLSSRLYLTRRTSVQSSTTASPLRSTSPSLCLPSWIWWVLHSFHRLPVGNKESSPW